MRNTFKNLGIGIGIFELIVFIGTCSFNHRQNPPPPAQTDTNYIKVLKEKQAELNTAYKKLVDDLQTANDSLSKSISIHKATLSVYRERSNKLEKQLINLITQSDSTKTVNDSISPLTENYFDIQHERDSTCNQTIRALELISAKKDSVIVIQNREKDNYRDLQKEQEQQALQLTEQLNTAYKQQRKANLKSKIGAGALLLMTGFASALLIHQTLK